MQTEMAISGHARFQRQAQTWEHVLEDWCLFTVNRFVVYNHKSILL